MELGTGVGQRAESGAGESLTPWRQGQKIAAGVLGESQALNETKDCVLMLIRPPKPEQSAEMVPG